MFHIAIKPKTMTLTDVYITSVSVQLDSTAYITGSVSGDGIGQGFNINLTKEEYSAWGDNDDYIINLVLTKLGLERA